MDPQYDGMIFKTHAEELLRRSARPFPPLRILDVRPPAEFARGHIAGAVSVTPLEAAGDLPTGPVEVIVVGRGQGDPAVREASKVLLRRGAHRVVEFEGGMYEWALAGYPVERATGAAGRAAA